VRFSKLPDCDQGRNLVRIVIAGILCVGLIGCFGPNPKLRVTDIAALPESTAQTADAIQVLSAAPEGVSVLGAIEATSCKNKLWEPEPTEANALAQLRVRAAELGAAALVGVTYTQGGTSLATNCWSIITARGTAIALRAKSAS
jgi:uncharacterized protein YbjQ (UPF0145 family)